LRSLGELFHKYDLLEQDLEIQSGLRYDDALQYDIIDLVMKWCDCETELECRQFIAFELPTKSISVGDFNKALLKIVTVANEIEKIGEELGELDCKYKMSQIGGMVLKYVTTSHSLYV
jgi:hypothetical protein